MIIIQVGVRVYSLIDCCKKGPQVGGYSKGLQNKNQMGKKLRNRQLRDQEESEVLPKEKIWGPAEELPNHRLKKMICKKLVRDNQNSQRQKRFYRRLEEGTFCCLVDETRLECPICLQMMVQPTMMLCGHMYCFRCLESNAVYSQCCCLCRQPQMDVPHLPSRFAEKLIHQILLPRSDQVIKYLCRTTDSNQWSKRRFVTNLRAGMVVDFHDSFNFWNKAVILRKQFDQNKNEMVLVKVCLKGEESIEKVEITSKRLAPARFFTKGRYLQEFQPSLPEYDFKEKQLHSLQYRLKLEEEEFFLSTYQPSEGFFNEDTESFINQIDKIESIGSSQSQNFLDEVLMLFNMEMNENDLIF